MSIRISYLGRTPLGRAFLGWGPVGDAPPPPAPIVPTDEAVNWIADRLGIDVLIGHLPQGSDNFPLFSYAIVGGATWGDLNGAINLRRWDVQMNAWSRDASEVLLAQQKLFYLLANYRGPMGRAYCQAAIAGRPRTDYFPDPASSDAGYYRASCDWALLLNG